MIIKTGSYSSLHIDTMFSDVWSHVLNPGLFVECKFNELCVNEVQWNNTVNVLERDMWIYICNSTRRSSLINITVTAVSRAF